LADWVTEARGSQTEGMNGAKGGQPSRTSRWYESRYHRTCRSSDLIVCECFGLPSFFQFLLTSGGGLAGVDVADDDDVDMSLLFTVMIKDMSVTFIDMKLDLIWHSEVARRQFEMVSYPMVAVELSVWFEVL
jgi:hypothetical protein